MPRSPLALGSGTARGRCVGTAVHSMGIGRVGFSAGGQFTRWGTFQTCRHNDNDAASCRNSSMKTISPQQRARAAATATERRMRRWGNRFGWQNVGGLIACTDQKGSDLQEDVAPLFRVPKRSATSGAAPNLAMAYRTCIARVWATAMRTQMSFDSPLGHRPVRETFTEGAFTPRRLHKGVPDIVDRNDSERRITASSNCAQMSCYPARLDGLS
jgi:hypothetical protein